MICKMLLGGVLGVVSEPWEPNEAERLEPPVAVLLHHWAMRVHPAKLSRMRPPTGALCTAWAVAAGGAGLMHGVQ